MVFILVDHQTILSYLIGDLAVVAFVVLSNMSEVARSLPEFLAATRSQALIGLLSRVFELVLDLVDFLGEPLWTILALKPLDVEVCCVVVPCEPVASSIILIATGEWAVVKAIPHADVAHELAGDLHSFAILLLHGDDDL